jgi:hypothetical protein
MLKVRLLFSTITSYESISKLRGVFGRVFPVQLRIRLRIINATLSRLRERVNQTQRIEEREKSCGTGN